MSINNKDDANKYYQIVNDLVDNYTEKWKIRPSNLKRYLKPGGERFNKFLAKNGLKDIKGSDIILRDIIEDRHHMEKDGVITFESFKLFESDDFKIHSLSQCLYKGIGKSTSMMEKVLADVFDTSLGQIDIIDADKHIFKVNGWENENTLVIIYNKEEVGVIVGNMIDHLYGELSNKKIELTKSISVELSDLVKEDQFHDRMKSKFKKYPGYTDIALNTITDCIGDGYEHYKEEPDFHIWIKSQ
jgi:hypothetical protein